VTARIDRPTDDTPMFDCRDAFADTLLDLMRTDPRVVAVVNDSVGSTKVSVVQKVFPDRVVNVGIAEQDLVGVGAGLANGGFIPFVAAASPFLTGRALEQIKVDAAYSQANVKLVGVSSGVAYGELGPTHHSIEDVAWTRAIADLTVVVPSDPVDTAAAIRLAHTTPGPVFIRTSRMPVPVVHAPDLEFRFGEAITLREGTDLTLIANGVLVHRALLAADLLAEDGVSARVLDMATVSPLDVAAIVRAARETGRIVVAEEHTTRGGLGGAVAEVVVQHQPVPMRLLGFPGVFAPTGSAEFLLDHFGLNAAGIRAAALDLLRGAARP
jgi:transketolase